jgi:hypothetical protein
MARSGRPNVVAVGGRTKRPEARCLRLRPHWPTDVLMHVVALPMLRRPNSATVQVAALSTDLTVLPVWRSCCPITTSVMP